jgi:hypothetical protein
MDWQEKQKEKYGWRRRKQMPTMKADVEFEVYCGICGEGVCYDTSVNNSTLTVTCSYCKKNIKNLKDRIRRLKAKIVADKLGVKKIVPKRLEKKKR